MSDLSEKIRVFIYDNFIMGESESEISNTDSLIDAGVLDSTAVIELVTFIEETFSVEMADDEIVLDNLDSIDAIEIFVSRKISEMHA